MDSNDLQNPQEFTLQDALAELQTVTSVTATLPPAVFYGFSDLPADQQRAFKDGWCKLDKNLRGRVARQLVETSEADFEFQYHQIAIVLLQDDLPEVRKAAIELLWENDTVAVMDRLLSLLAAERDPLVKSEVLNALGRFIRLGEYEDIPADDAERAQDAVMQVLKDPNASLLVRRRALEAISNCTRDDVRPLIQAAYESPQHDMRVSALYAMGRSCDSYWGEIVLQEMNSDNPEMQY
ncbi:MAG: HEAT repeat domain-containing protein, partial [Chloroflexota bacterium]